jgi:hypothetical protein
MYAPPENASAARARGGAAEKIQGDDVKPLLNSQPLTKAQADLLDRLEIVEQLSRWKLDLQARLWRTQQTFMLVDVDHDFGPLADEVEAFKRVCRVLAWRPEAAA